jgi:hypothetical protein
MPVSQWPGRLKWLATGKPLFYVIDRRCWAKRSLHIKRASPIYFMWHRTQTMAQTTLRLEQEKLPLMLKEPNGKDKLPVCSVWGQMRQVRPQHDVPRRVSRGLKKRLWTSKSRRFLSRLKAARGGSVNMSRVEGSVSKMWKFLLTIFTAVRLWGLWVRAKMGLSEEDLDENKSPSSWNTIDSLESRLQDRFRI